MSANIISMKGGRKLEAGGLPEFPEELKKLPGKLGELQDYIFGRMTYPCRATAGFYSFIVMTMILQTNNTIKSRDGLGLNEYFLALAPTGFGKEEIRKLIGKLFKALGLGDRNGEVRLQYAAPPSMQGIHQLLEHDGRSSFFMADEFANWLKQSGTDSNKSNALNYLMECYTKALDTVYCGNAANSTYTPVSNPRVSVVATSTGETMFETLTRSQAESGAYNRWVIFVGPERLPDKVYEGQVYEPSEDLLSWLRQMCEVCDDSRPGMLRYSHEGYQRFVELDRKLAEPAKARDGVIGGRLAEQAIKMAAIIALSEGHHHISPEDMELGFSIRMGLYKRASAAISKEGNIDGNDATVKAKDQLAKALETHKELYLSQLYKNSRAYSKLDVRNQLAVRNALVAEGICKLEGKKLILVE